LQENTLNKILVFNPSFIGDSILTTPLITVIKKLYPKSKISFCVRPESSELFECLEDINEMIIFDKRNKDRGLKGIIDFSQKLRNEGFDLIISPHKSFRTVILLKLSGCKNIVGFKEAACSFLFDSNVHRDMNLHEVERNLLLLFNISEDYSFDEIKKMAEYPKVCSDSEYEKKLRILFKCLKKDCRKIACIAPASVWNTKMWPVEHYARVIEKLFSEHIYSLVIASKKEYSVIRRLKDECSVPFLDFAAKTSLSELSAIIKNIDILLCNDSAPMHIAASHKTPVVAIFGPTTENLGFFPYGEGESRVIEDKNLDCRPCALHGGKKCPEKHFKCMRNISPVQVYTTVMELIL